MLDLLLSFGALDALIPLLIILILLAAAAGISRGYDIFSILGISVLAGIGRAGTSKGSFAGKSAYRGYIAGRVMAGAFKGSTPEKAMTAASKKAGAAARGGVSNTLLKREAKARANAIFNSSVLPGTAAPGRYNAVKNSRPGRLVRGAVNFSPIRAGVSVLKKSSRLSAAGSSIKNSGAGRWVGRRWGFKHVVKPVANKVANFRPIRDTLGLATFGAPYVGAKTGRTVWKGMGSAAPGLSDVKGAQGQVDEVIAHIGSKAQGNPLNPGQTKAATHPNAAVAEWWAIKQQGGHYISLYDAIKSREREKGVEAIETAAAPAIPGIGPAIPHNEIVRNMQRLYQDYNKNRGTFSKANIQQLARDELARPARPAGPMGPAAPAGPGIVGGTGAPPGPSSLVKARRLFFKKHSD